MALLKLKYFPSIANKITILQTVFLIRDNFIENYSHTHL